MVKVITGLAEGKDTSSRAVQQCAIDILRSRLLTPSESLLVLNQVKPFAMGLDDDPDAHVEFARIASELRRSGSGIPSPSGFPRFFDHLAKASARPDGRTLADLVTFEPGRHERAAASYIQRYASRFDTGFVIRSYLDTASDPSVIGPKVMAWLDEFRKHRGASFVIGAWLRAADRLLEKGIRSDPVMVLDPVVNNHLRAWCSRFRSDPVAFWNLQALIERCGYDASSDVVTDWLSQYGETVNAGFVLQKALYTERGHDQRIVSWAVDWLDSETGRSNPTIASYLFRALRECVLKHGTVQFEDFSCILLEHAELEGALHQRRDMCRYWLELGGDPGAVKFRLRTLVQRDVTDPNVRFCFETWDTFSEHTPDLLKQEMKAWLDVDKNAANPKAGLVFDIWSNRGWKLEVISDALHTWLKANPQNSHYPRMLAIYLRSGVGIPTHLGISEEGAPAFLEKAEFAVQDCRNIEFILMAPFSEDEGGPIFKAAVAAVDRYLNQHGKKDAAAFLIALVLRRLKGMAWIKAHADAWLDEFPHRHRASLIYQALVEVEGRPEDRLGGIKDWFGQNPTYGLAGNLLLAWVDATDDPAALMVEARTWLRAASREHAPDVEAVARAYYLNPAATV